MNENHEPMECVGCKETFHGEEDEDGICPFCGAELVPLMEE